MKVADFVALCARLDYTRGLVKGHSTLTLIILIV